MGRMILAIASIGMAFLFVCAAPTPGLAGEAGLQFVGYRHGELLLRIPGMRCLL
jgi:hypothetical protein